LPEVNTMLKTLLLLFVALNLYAENIVGGIAVLVENEPITLHEVSEAMREHSQSAEDAVKLLVRKKLEEVEASERGIKVTSQEVLDDIQKMARQNNMSIMEFYEAIRQTQGMSEASLKKAILEKLTNQKLYNAIAFSQIEQPTPEEEEEYYQIHKQEFSVPQGFTVIVYRSASKERLEEKANNPMLYAPDVKSESVTLKAEQIDPRLVQMLMQTPLNTFTPVLPDREGFTSFYVQEKLNSQTPDLETIRPQLTQQIIGQKRQQVLNDYFSRLRMTADVRIIRLPE
jgi:peptidyl-prolyl cis-trans isomerase SurA